MLLGFSCPFQERTLIFSISTIVLHHHLQETVEAEGGGGCEGEQEQGGGAPGDQRGGTAREQGGLGEEQQPAPSLLPHTLQAPNTKPNLPMSSCIHCTATLLLHLLLLSDFYLAGTGDAYFPFSVSIFCPAPNQSCVPPGEAAVPWSPAAPPPSGDRPRDTALTAQDSTCEPAIVTIVTNL